MSAYLSDLVPTVLATGRLFLSVPSCPKRFTLAFPSDVKVLRSLYDWLFSSFGTQSATADSSEKSSLIIPSNVHSLLLLSPCLVLFYS